MSNRIEIRYCPKCRWLPRATWTAQELLTTFEEEIAELKLVPAGSGEFSVLANDRLLWSRGEQGGFPELKKLKQLVRDVVAPSKTLGHSDTKKESE
jgi:selenoprotein W-related protein